MFVLLAFLACLLIAAAHVGRRGPPPPCVPAFVWGPAGTGTGRLVAVKSSPPVPAQAASATRVHTGVRPGMFAAERAYLRARSL